jgi:hypothetical protein
VLKNISSGFRVIILTVLLAGAAAVIRPIADAEEIEEDEDDSALMEFEQRGGKGR